MRAMQLAAAGKPLRLVDREIGKPDAGQLLLRVLACGVCRTDLHIADGELPRLARPAVPGHEVVGEVIERGARSERFSIGQRVGVPWLGWTCGDCAYCRSGRENLCDSARFTGYQIDGGYAEFALADSRYCFALPEGYAPAEAAPLLCSGLIGYRALAAAGDARTLSIYGFGAAAHIVAQVARFQGRRLFAFTRAGEEFLALAPRVPVRTSVETFPLERANEALARLREGRISGAAVLVVQEPRG